MKKISDSQPGDALRGALARRAQAVQPVARLVSPRRWRRQWLPALVVAIVVAITCVLLAWTPLFDRQRHPTAASARQITD